MAAAHGYNGLLKVLLEQGADVNAQSDELWGTALLAAAFGGHEEVVVMLLEKGADIICQGELARRDDFNAQVRLYSIKLQMAPSSF